MLFIHNLGIRYIIWVLIGLVVLSCTRMLYARQAFSFILGVFLSNYKMSFEYLKRKNFSLNVALLAVLLLAIKQFPFVRTTPSIVQNSLDMLMTISFVVSAIFILSITDKHLLTPFYYLGVISYEIYLTHGYTLWFVDLSILNALFFFLITIGIAITIHFPIKKLQERLLTYL